MTANAILQVKKLIWFNALELLQRGTDVILDFSNWGYLERSKWRETAERNGFKTKFYYLNCSVTICRKRLENRNREVCCFKASRVDLTNYCSSDKWRLMTGTMCLSSIPTAEIDKVIWIRI